MILSDKGILEEITFSPSLVTPFDRECLQPASLDVKLAEKFLVWSCCDVIDPAAMNADLLEVTLAPDEPFLLAPGLLVLGSTVERVSLPDHLAVEIRGKSTLGRIGIMVHSTAGWIDPGFRGNITLELSNLNSVPVKLWPGMRIGQLTFFRLSSPASTSYHGRYQDQSGPVPPRTGGICTGVKP